MSQPFPPSSIPRRVNPTTRPRRPSPEPEKEVFIKNEPPPFKVFPDFSAGNGRRGSSRQTSSGSDVEIQAVVGSGAKGVAGPIPSGSKSGGSTIGMGQPSHRKASAPTTSKGRSISNRSRLDSTPRSASLNMLASPSSSGSPIPTPTSSRLGVAAHFIPPESTYTPPKGTNWDEVVLPAVAKRLGIGVVETERSDGEEGDLAVEWDKDGTPIKWLKRHLASRGDTLFDPGSTSSSSPSYFSPTFETSFDNPLCPESPGDAVHPAPAPATTSFQPSLGQKRSAEGLGPHLPSTSEDPALRSRRVNETHELQPLRILDVPGSFIPTDPPNSLAPPLPRYPDSADPSTQGHSTSPAPFPTGFQTPLRTPTHRSSSHTLPASRQPSQRSMRQTSYQNPRTPPAIQVQSATPGPTDVRQDATIGTQRRSEQTQPIPMEARRTPSKVVDRNKHHDDVGKGCGCIVM
ncbi:MAG: hypothetical protein TREMPRED_005007 [Tremellales sp. Tagirdzhanova-0007]|nr:MAG: hypothetical protein TREMPRED_005007 [Tremellales sp. Tagirdzhanova-0007]